MQTLTSFGVFGCSWRWALAFALLLPALVPHAAAPRTQVAQLAAESVFAVASSISSREDPGVNFPPAYGNLYYRPIEKPDYPRNPRVAAKGLYATLYSVATPSRLDELIQIADTTEINSLVIDVKDDRGHLLWPMAAAERYHPEANRKTLMKDPGVLLERLRRHRIYPIARVVVFKDPSYATAHASSAILDPATGGPYTSRDGLHWSSPYDRDFRAYNLAIAREAAAAGFREIQFDYVRFPDVSRSRKLDYRNPAAQSKAQAIQSFLLEARGVLVPLQVYVAADVFGLVCTTLDDMNIGQYWEAISNAVDYLCPMMYPSHYGPDVYGFRVPDKEPYGVIARGLDDALRRNKNLATPATLRPWLQGFTATWLPEYRSYGVTEIKAQIRACQERGIDSYLIWNAANRYQPAAFR